jgi:biopolymer transport protein ExbB/TolQ
MTALISALQVLMEHGGFAAYLIFAAGAVLVIIGAERLVVLFWGMSYNVKGSVVTIRSLILDKRYTDAIQICDKRPNSPEMSVIKSGLVAVENGREAMKSALGGAVLEVSHKCETRVGYLALIANVATLLGLLGTISGLIKTFASIANADPAEKARLLGLGISEAMYATAAGLCVGIAAMVIHTLCVSKGESIVGDAQDTGLKVITWIEQSERVNK